MLCGVAQAVSSSVAVPRQSASAAWCRVGGRERVGGVCRRGVGWGALGRRWLGLGGRGIES